MRFAFTKRDAVLIRHANAASTSRRQFGRAAAFMLREIRTRTSDLESRDLRVLVLQQRRAALTLLGAMARSPLAAPEGSDANAGDVWPALAEFAKAIQSEIAHVDELLALPVTHRPRGRDAR